MNYTDEILTNISENFMYGMQIDNGVIQTRYGENITIGNDNVNQILSSYDPNCKFSLWKAEFTIDAEFGFPTKTAINRNISNIIDYVQTSQQNNILPIVHLDFNVDKVTNNKITGHIMREVISKMFREFAKSDIMFDVLLLVINPVYSNNRNSELANDELENIEDISLMTFRIIQDVVPASVPGIIISPSKLNHQDYIGIMKTMLSIDTVKPWKISFMIDSSSASLSEISDYLSIIN